MAGGVGAALENVGDVYILALETHRGDDLIEKLARAADERLALAVFLRAGGLADEHHFRIHVAHAEDDVVVLLPARRDIYRRAAATDRRADWSRSALGFAGSVTGS